MAIPIQSTAFNPITGVFGTGQVLIVGGNTTATWTVPPGIGKVRARCFGGGGSGGGGGGFAIKTIYDLSGVTSIPVIAGGIGGTSSFGTYVSATAGYTTGIGSGVGGDINYSGGTSGGGGVASIFGNGGSTYIPGASGFVLSTANGSGGLFGSGNASSNLTSGLSGSLFSIDFIGTGGGGSNGFGGINGGGGPTGGYPGGGGTTLGAPGMVIVEW